MKNFVKDILICIKRLYDADSRIDDFIRSGGQTDVLSCLDLSGERIEPHPILKYSSAQKKVFTQCFGPPLKYPPNTSPHEVKKIIEERREFMRLCCGMIENSQDERFLGFHNYLCKNDPYITEGQLRIGKKERRKTRPNNSRRKIRKGKSRKKGNMVGKRDKGISGVEKKS